MLRWILGVLLKDKIRNDEIRRCGVVFIAGKVKEARLRWYGHVLRRSEEEPIRSIMELNRGKPRTGETKEEMVRLCERRFEQERTNISYDEGQKLLENQNPSSRPWDSLGLGLCKRRRRIGIL